MQATVDEAGSSDYGIRETWDGSSPDRQRQDAISAGTERWVLVTRRGARLRDRGVRPTCCLSHSAATI